MSKTARILTVLLASVMLFALALPAFADVILEPHNSFYDEHADECTAGEQRMYVAKEGGLVVAVDPESDMGTLFPSGSYFWSCWQYNDGRTVWGYIENYEDPGKAGWFKLGDVYRVYDHIDFEKEHGSEFYEDKTEHTFTSAVAYDYPNGPVDHVIDGEDATYLLDDLVFNSLYRDENGREWGFIGYRFGRWNVWICLDEPDNAGLDETGMLAVDPVTGEILGAAPKAAGADDEPQQTSVCVGTDDPNEDPDATPVPPGAHTDPKTEHDKGLIALAIAGAAAVSAAVLALVFKKPKQK